MYDRDRELICLSVSRVECGHIIHVKSVSPRTAHSNLPSAAFANQCTTVFISVRGLQK